MEDFKAHIREIEDFPTKGISFKDITTLLKDGPAFHRAVQQLKNQIDAMLPPFDAIVAPESRGFILGSYLAYPYRCGFVPLRKQGKLPGDTHKITYKLEYGTATLEVHTDALAPGSKVLYVDDLLATGGTARASLDLIAKLGAEPVGAAFLIELNLPGARELLNDVKIVSLIQY